MRKAIAAVAVVAVAGIGLWAALGGEPARSPGTTPDGRPDPGAAVEVSGRDFMRRACQLPPRWVRYIRRGWDPSPASATDIVLVPEARNYVGSFEYTPHSGPYGYLQRVPMIWYGPGFIERNGPISPDREITVADIAPTQARLLGFEQWPRQRPGRVLTEALADTDERPRLLVLISIDGGGWNVLEEWPDAWPVMRRLRQEGTSYENAVVGSSPSITPAVHTTMSTGTWPRYHGVTAIGVRQDDGDIVGGFAESPDTGGAYVADPTINLRTTTLPDLYDQATGNAAQVAMIASGNYALGLVGHGAALSGGDRDIAAMHARDGWGTNEDYYEVPDYLNNGELAGPRAEIEAVDRMDGRADGKWRGHDIPLDASPAFAPYQNRAAMMVMEREGFGQDEVTDLLYIQYKAPDAAGHRYNMIAPEQEDVLRSVDSAIGELVDFLDEEVGRGSYAMVITADHGQTPLEVGGWPINRNEIRKDIDEAFRRPGRPSVIQRTSSTVFFMSRKGMRANGVTPEEISSFLTHYTIGDNIPPGENPPSGFEDRVDERIFAAAFPGRALPEVVACTGALRR